MSPHDYRRKLARKPGTKSQSQSLSTTSVNRVASKSDCCITLVQRGSREEAGHPQRKQDTHNLTGEEEAGRRKQDTHNLTGTNPRKAKHIRYPLPFGALWLIFPLNPVLLPKVEINQALSWYTKTWFSTPYQENVYPSNNRASSTMCSNASWGLVSARKRLFRTRFCRSGHQFPGTGRTERQGYDHHRNRAHPA